jgi:hypothetical protein
MEIMAIVAQEYVCLLSELTRNSKAKISMSMAADKNTRHSPTIEELEEHLQKVSFKVFIHSFIVHSINPYT